MERKAPVSDLPETRPVAGTGPARYRRGRWKAVVAAHMEELYAGEFAHGPTMRGAHNT